MLALALILPVLALVTAAPMKRYSGVQIVSARNGQCLAAAPKTGVGSPVTTVDCGNTVYPTYWDINPGSGSVILTGTNLALDAGDDPENFSTLKVWTSYPGLYQQTWYLTNDHYIAITGGTQCLDEGDNGPQTYQCTTGDTNQHWTIGNQGIFPSSSVSVSTSSSMPSCTCA